ncbi:MAG: ketoacyl-ACP synthase III [Spirochaetes bacterium]|nr:ketoacyl-ACP synthase III [Spirochaetota bacterium]
MSIVDFGCWIPDKIIASSHLQTEIDRFPHLRSFKIAEKAGVVERRCSPDVVTVLDMAEMAARDAIYRARKRCDFAIEEIDTILYCAVFRQYTEPSTACLIQKRLGIPSAMSLDISDACLSFVNGLIIADSLIATGRSRMVLIVSAEKPSRVLKNSFNAMMRGERGPECLPSLTVGDGAIAAIVSSRSIPSKPLLQLSAFSRTTLAEYAECCILPSDDKPMVTDARTMFEGALAHFPDMFRRLLHDLKWDLDDISAIIPHQASRKIIERGMDLIGFPMSKCPLTLDEFGNMGAVSVPYTLKQAFETRPFIQNDKIVLLGFGSGLSFSIMALLVMHP